MATRLYFKTTATAGASPAYTAGWNFTSEAQRRRMSTGRTDTAGAAGTLIGAWPANTTTYALDRQYVSDPLDSDFSISGTVKGVVRALEGQAGDNIDQVHIAIYVVNGDGSAVRGTLLALGCYGATQELLTSYRSRVIADGDALTTVNALTGDRIVVELGYRASGAAGAPATPEGRMTWGAVDTRDDLPENDTETAELNPWIEFSQDIPLQAGVARIDNAYVEVPRSVPFVAGVARVDAAYVEVIRSVDNPLSLPRKKVRYVSVSFG